MDTNNQTTTQATEQTPPAAEITPLTASGGGPTQPVGETYGKEDVEKIVKARLEQERKKYTDYADLKAKATKWAEYEEAQKTELQKFQDRAVAAEAERERAQAEVLDVLIQAAFIAEAAKLDVAHPEDAYALADIAAIALEGKKVTGVAEQVKALVEAGRLPTRGKPQAPRLDGGAGSGERPRADEKPLSQAELDVARRMGLSPEQYAKGKIAPKKE